MTSHGYPLESHHVVTPDGFILQMYRIPCGRNSHSGADSDSSSSSSSSFPSDGSRSSSSSSDTESSAGTRRQAAAAFMQNLPRTVDSIQHSDQVHHMGNISTTLLAIHDAPLLQNHSQENGHISSSGSITTYNSSSSSRDLLPTIEDVDDIATRDTPLLQTAGLSNGSSSTFSSGSSSCGSNSTQPVVLFQHALMDSSAGWLLLGPGKSLPFLLADQGEQAFAACKKI